MIRVDVRAKILTAESKPYDFAGNQGTSHKVRVSIDGEIYICNSSAEQVVSLQPHVLAEGSAVIGIESRKERLSLTLVEFEEA